MLTLGSRCVFTPSRRSCYLLPPEELLEEVVRLRLSEPISLLTRVRRSVDMLFLETITTKIKKCICCSKNYTLFFFFFIYFIPLNGLCRFFSRGGGGGEEAFLLNIAITHRSGGKSLQDLTHWKFNNHCQIMSACQWLFQIVQIWKRLSSVQGFTSVSSHFAYLWWAGLEPQQPEASSPRLLSAPPGSAPRSSPADAGRQPGPISAAGFHPPEAAASAPGGRPGPPCPCCCWLTPCHLESSDSVHKKILTTILSEVWLMSH